MTTTSIGSTDSTAPVLSSARTRSALAGVLRAGTPLVVAGDASAVHRLVLAPSVVATLTPTVATTGDAGGAPLADSRNGNLFADGADPNTSWYLPAYALCSPDPAFGFAAVQDGADAQGRPFNRGTVSVGLCSSVPADVQAAIQAQPTRTFKPIPIQSLDASLTLLTKADDGTDVRTTTQGRVTITGPDTLTANFDALLGSTVVVAFSSLTATGQAELTLRASYDQVRWQVVAEPATDDDPSPRFPESIHEPPVEGVVLRQPPAVRRLHPVDPGDDPHPNWDQATVTDVSRSPQLRGLQSLIAGRASSLATDRVSADLPILRLPGRRLPDGPWRKRRVAVHDTASEAYALPLGLAYAGPSYRPEFTISANGQTRGIVSAQDLQEFHVSQSEYVEFTRFGSVASRYPSLRALYLGQVSGTVLAIPAAYGILRSRSGCAISCDAVVDASAASGCRFQLTFTLAPLVDAGDLARLTADLAAEPSLATLQPKLALPTDLDRRAASSLSSPNVTAVAYGVGLVPDTYTVTVGIVDDDVPAVVKVNLILAQLTAGSASLLGRIAVRLDDAYEQTVMADVLLNLRNTSGSDDVTLVVDSQSGAVGVANQSDLDLTVHEVTSHVAVNAVGNPPTSNGFTTTVVDQPLPADGSLALDLPDGSDQAYVDCALDLPNPFPPTRLPEYVAIHAETVQQVHHAIGFNAAGQLSGIATVAIELAIDGLTDLVVPTVTLSPSHPVDNTAIEVPVTNALTGLAATLSLTVTPVDGGPPVQLSLQHDFGEHPIMILTRDQLGPVS